MAFPEGWEHRVSITIDKDDIDADLTDWTLVFDQSFDSVLTSVDGPLDADGQRPSINGGGDIRFSSDAAGANRLACDIRTWATNNTPGSATCEIAVKIGSVSSSTDTTIYMWWGKSGETQPGVSTTYGQYNAYDSGFIGVWSLSEDPGPGGAGDMKDRTSNQLNGTAHSGFTDADSVDAKVGKGVRFQAGNDIITVPDSALLDPGGEVTVSCCVNHASIVPGVGLVIHDDTNYKYLLYSTTGGVYFYIRTASGVSNTSPRGVATSTWYHLCGTFDRSLSSERLKLYVNGSQERSATGYDQDILGGDEGLHFGEWSGHLNGTLDEVRVSSVARSAAWIEANYHNQFNTSGFLTWGSITDIADALDADEIASATDVENPTLGQVHALAADEIASATDVENPTIGQIHKLVATFDAFDSHWQNLISVWQLEEASSTRYDAHGSNDLSDVNTVSRITGKHNYGAGFDDANSEYLNLAEASVSGFSGAGEFTVSAWIKIDSGDTGLFSIVGQFETGGQPHWILRVGANEGPGRVLEFLVGTTLENDEGVSAAGAVPEDEWVHVVGRWDGSNVRVFINGEDATQSAGAVSGFYGNNGDLRIGYDDSGSGVYADGDIDEVYVWVANFTAAQIKELYNGGSGVYYDQRVTVPVSIETPTLGQVYALAADEIASATEVETPTLGQIHALAADEIA